jgi:hypothetical protein
MDFLKSTSIEATAAITAETETFTEPYFENYLSFPFPDKRSLDRRISDRRSTQ